MMLRSFTTDEHWRNFETLTLLHPYKTLQGQIAKTFAPYKDMIKRYSGTSNHSIEVITTEYVEEHPEVSIQNVALLKNAIELWKTASQTSDMVAPVLYHYSIHCFISFFNYTFFRWDPQHARSHGITISRWGKELSDIEIEISQSKKSLFQRFLDTWILLGACLAFSPHLPIMETEEIEFIPNGRFLLTDSNCISLKQLLIFDAEDFERNINLDLRGKRFKGSFSATTDSPNNYFKNYLIVFVASSLARYRPYLWMDVMVGKTSEQSEFSLASTGALVNITRHFFYNVSSIFQEIRNERFRFQKYH